MSDGVLRIGDAEREQASVALGEHLGQGRLDPTEHADRLDRVWSARTRADLEPLFSDLPAPRPAGLVPPPATPAWNVERGRSVVRRGPPLVPIAIVLLALSALVHAPVFLLIAPAAWFAIRRQSARHTWASTRSAEPTLR